MHWLLLVQLLPQLVPLHRYVPQSRFCPGTHTPDPLQVGPAVSVAPLHVWLPQLVPVVCSRQPPVPLHPPARPQVVAASAGHSFWGSCPPGMGVQLPSAPATLQAWQGWLQGPLQQTPSVHRPLAHWKAMVQAAPGMRRRVQRVPSQKKPVWQSVWLVQVAAQLPPMHMLGAQLREEPARQVPLPSQVLAAVNARLAGSRKRTDGTMLEAVGVPVDPV